MRNLSVVFFCLAVTSTLRAAAPGATPAPETVDTAAISRIMDEGTNRSQVMETLLGVTDLNGPRLTWSPGYARAAEYLIARMSAWGLENPRIERWAPLGVGWTLKEFSANVLTPYAFPLHAHPRAWSNGVRGTVRAEVVHLEAASDSALQLYRGKLKGRFVLLGDSVEFDSPFEPVATRETDSSLLALANAGTERRGRRPGGAPGGGMQRWILAMRKLQLCQEEKAAGMLFPSRAESGILTVQGVTVPDHPDTPFADRLQAYDRIRKELIPQISVSADHYNRMLRLVRAGKKVTLELELEVEATPPDSGANVIAEIPGTDLKDEVVMVGGHLDSWHGGTGGNDNGTGVATSMEAVRILKALGLKPRRTIRIGLWGGEEQGLYGSEAYVSAHLGKAVDDSTAPRGKRYEYKPEGGKFCAYFNNDNGTGRIRGIYLQGNEALRPIFRKWLEPFRDKGASTITPLPTGGTDILAFNEIGLPGFQFIQDDIDYFTRTWHTTSDTYDRALPDDLKQASVIMAAFIYNAAMRDEPLPRKQR
jgi:carboxypeptidase Q